MQVQDFQTFVGMFQMFLLLFCYLKLLSSIYRPMTLVEKQQLRKLIQALPPKNLDRVVEIIQRSKPAEKESCDEIHVDLEKEVENLRHLCLFCSYEIITLLLNSLPFQSNATLWRLYYYVEAFERTRNSSYSSISHFLPVRD